MIFQGANPIFNVGSLSNIAIDEKGMIVLSICSSDELIFRSGISLSNIKNNEWKKIYINLPLENKEYTINFSAQDCIQVPNILLVDKEDASKESISCYADNLALDGEIALKYGYLREITLANMWIHFTLWAIIYFLIAIGLFYFEYIYGCLKSVINQWFSYTDVIGIIFEVILALVIVNTSGIKFQETTKIIFYIISLSSAYKLYEKNLWVKKQQDKLWKKISLYFLYGYGSFSLAGQRILIYPLNKGITLGEIVVFIAAFIWFIPVINSMVYLFGILRTKIFDVNLKEWKNLKFTLICSIFLLLPAGFNLYANNPGISSQDTMICMVTNARHLNGMYDWHPVFYCAILRIILKIWDSTYAVILTQYFFWLYVMLEGLLYLKKRHMSNILLLFTAFLSGICAGNFLHLNTIWKDIPYTLSVLWCVILIAKLTFDFEIYRNKWYIYIELFVALIGTCLYRKNGIVTFIITMISLLVFLRKNKKIWITGGLILTTLTIVKGPIYKYLEIKETGQYGMYIGLGQDILGAYYSGGEISEETLQMITIMTGHDIVEYEYTPTWARQDYNLYVTPPQFIKSYLDTFIHNPILMIRAIIAREDALWNIFPGEDAVLGGVNYTETMDEYDEWSKYYPERKFNSFQTVMSKFTTYTANNQWISAIEWRCGLHLLFALVAIITTIWDRGIKKYLLIVAPMIGHTFSLLLSTGWSDFRYYWPINLMSLFVILFMSSISNKIEKDYGKLGRENAPCSPSSPQPSTENISCQSSTAACSPRPAKISPGSS
ncbi:MAG: hypothetical protein HFI31_11555 [Lachnospiraceae bacterium]|nr:hypothetical protein [Lachnospiraceae bacterium]